MFDIVLKYIPGAIGIALRNRVMKIVYNKNMPYTDIGCFFDCIDNMQFYYNVAIGMRGYFSACKGEIIIKDNTSFNHNVHINASCGGRIIIGKNCLIGPNVVMRTADHNYANPNILIRNQGHTTGDITINDDVWISAGVIILKDVEIGQGSVIGAGSVVTKNIPPMSIAVGIPARVIKHRSNVI